MFVEGSPGMHGFGGGWVLYPPFSSTAGTPGPAMDFVILSLHLAAPPRSSRDQFHHQIFNSARPA